MSQSLKRIGIRTLSIETLVILVLAVTGVRAGAEVTIAQVDPSRLLTGQRVDVYVSVTDANGNTIDGLSSRDFSLFEGAPDGKLQKVDRFGFQEGADASDGITFFLLVDNSGSMYDPMRPTDSASPPGVRETRIEAAKAAIATFLNSVDNPADRIGLATFNTFYRVAILPTDVRARVEKSFADISQPQRPDAFTELYASLSAASHDLAGSKGRKVIILLTDGENFPYAVHTGNANPQFGSHVVASDEAISSLIREGISVFPIHFGPAQQDSNLRTIARSTGGRVYDARSEEELANVYLDVRRRVLKEYRLSYAPRMIPGDRRIVSVEYHGPDAQGDASQYYFVGTLFGAPSGRWNPLLLVPLVVALLLWFLISRMRFMNRRTGANLEVLAGGATQVFPITAGQTVISFGNGTDVTIGADQAGAPRSGDEVTVIRDGRTGEFTVESGKPVMVNNRPTQKRVLKPGDVLRVGDATVVFDDEKDR
ncbi:MAG TPA: VWA domain-containing protein [Spirochaetia bacterium]|nr:VWA domain-containing protein [Spirochaetia bacterium]